MTIDRNCSLTFIAAIVIGGFSPLGTSAAEAPGVQEAPAGIESVVPLGIEKSRSLMFIAAAALGGGSSLGTWAADAPEVQGTPAGMESVVLLRIQGMTPEDAMRSKVESVHRYNGIVVAPGLIIAPRYTERPLLIAPGEFLEVTPVSNEILLAKTGHAMGKGEAELRDIYGRPPAFGEPVTIVGRDAEGTKIVLSGAMGRMGVELDEDLVTSRVKHPSSVEYGLARKIAAELDGDDSWKIMNLEWLYLRLSVEQMANLGGAGVFDKSGALIGMVSSVKFKRMKGFSFDGREYGYIGMPSVTTLRLFYAHQIELLLGRANRRN